MRYKILIIFIITICLCGCFNKKLEVNESNNNDETKLNIEDTQDEEIISEPQLPLYVDDNVMPIGLYMSNYNGSYKLVSSITSPMTKLKDIASFEALTSNEELVTGRFKNIWKDKWYSFQNNSNYKIGYHINFKLDDGTEYDTNIFKPSDTDKYVCFIQTYLYDDINVPDNTRYSHLEDSNINENTFITTIKLTAGTYVESVTYPITLSVFTYDSDDFDSDGNYRGNSIYTVKIYKVN